MPGVENTLIKSKLSMSIAVMDFLREAEGDNATPGINLLKEAKGENAAAGTGFSSNDFSKRAEGDNAAASIDLCKFWAAF